MGSPAFKHNPNPNPNPIILILTQPWTKNPIITHSNSLLLEISWHRSNKRVRNFAVSKEPWDISEVIRDKHGINKNIPGLGPQKKYSSRTTSASEKARLVYLEWPAPTNWRMRKWNTELAYFIRCYTLIRCYAVIRCHTPCHVVRCRGSQECGSRFVNFIRDGTVFT